MPYTIALLATAAVLLVQPAAPLDAQEPAERERPLAGAETVFPAVAGGPTTIHLRDLDAVRAVNERAALTAALARAQDERRRRELESDRLAKGKPWSVTPREVADVLRIEYGAGSALTRGAAAVATIADAAERSTQAPLDRVNDVTQRLTRSSSQALGIPAPPKLTLRSRVSTRKAGVGVSTKW
ncbi:MAG: hypothetical protein D6760_00570 [Deltaproteobacteria bacterium]|nr:MAG: hypothetical protein D6760_00570 [Deltaproteobacteria bacterium]